MIRRVIIFAPNWLGDAVMALPAIRAVHQTFPEGTLEVAARPSVAPLFSLVPEISRVLVLERGMRSAPALEEGRYDAALLLPNSYHTARLAKKAGIPERWGYRGDFRAWMLTRSVPRPFRLHQVDDYRGLAHAVGCAGGEGDPRIAVTEGVRAKGQTSLVAAGWDGLAPLVALAPGAAFGSAKRWPAVSFARLSDRLATDGVRPVLIGSAGDRAAGAEFAAALGGQSRPLDLIGRTDLPQLAGVLAHCRALVTNDSGAMHFAAALGVNVTVMFGPTRERETYPRGSGRHAFLTHPVWCRPCMLRECPLTHRCMTGISVNAVHAATQSLL